MLSKECVAWVMGLEQVEWSELYLSELFEEWLYIEEARLRQLPLAELDEILGDNDCWFNKEFMIDAIMSEYCWTEEEYVKWVGNMYHEL